MKKYEEQPRPRKVSRLPQCNKSNRLMRRYRTPSRAGAVFDKMMTPFIGKKVPFSLYDAATD